MSLDNTSSETKLLRAICNMRSTLEAGHILGP